MESSSSSLEGMELQQMQPDEMELHKKCLAWFKKLKIHLEYFHSSFKFINPRTFEIKFRVFFREKYQTFREKMYHNLNQLQWQLERDNFHRHDSKTCLVKLETKIKEIFYSKEVNASGFPNKCWQESFNDVQEIKEIEKWLKESELQQQESLITKGAAIKACLVTEGAVLEACLVNEGITLNDNMGVTESSGTELANSSSETLFRSSADENKSPNKESSSSEGNDADANIGSSNDSNTVLGVYHDLFKNMFAHGIQNHKQPESILDTYGVNDNNSNIISDKPNMDPDRNKEEHDYVECEQHRAFFASLINNLKCDVEKCNEVNREAQQANALLINELKRYKEKEKHFAKDMTIESEYCKKIKLLNDEISNLKSQACEKDKTITNKIEKYEEYVQPLLERKNELKRKFKKDNVITGKQGLGFENQNDDVNPSLLNKAKELAPCLYNIDEMGKDLPFDHKIITKKELKCKAKKCLKVRQRKSSLSYHGFVYAEAQFEEPPKDHLKRRNVNLKKHLEQTQNLKEHFEQAQLRDHDPNL
ncbi:hypothetical protein Tco_0077220 [Tanacetum coccineum]